MIIEILQSKIHRAIVTNSEIDYEGSIFIDENILKKAEILPYQKVEIYNINNGERFATYAVPVPIEGEFCINGAAARKVQKGDRIIVCAFASVEREKAIGHTPKVLLVQERNVNYIVK
ncbi:MAG: aspartate 1-decarboxylase [Proteobacteria bacterium]|jgi:aspartate 1-decarboxylase|nr:aspartate 1-decarboxylase [Pseudomonadota bacterium]